MVEFTFTPPRVEDLRTEQEGHAFYAPQPQYGAIQAELQSVATYGVPSGVAFSGTVGAFPASTLVVRPSGVAHIVEAATILPHVAAPATAPSVFVSELVQAMVSGVSNLVVTVVTEGSHLLPWPEATFAGIVAGAVAAATVKTVAGREKNSPKRL